MLYLQSPPKRPRVARRAEDPLCATGSAAIRIDRGVFAFSPFHWRYRFAAIARVKFVAASLLVICVVATTACNTLVTRRDLYGPKKAEGKYSTIMRKSTYIYGVQPQPHAPPPTPFPSTASPLAPAQQPLSPPTR